MKNRYKVASLIFALFFLVFLPHNSLLNNIEEAFKENNVLSRILSANNSQAQEKEAAAERKLKQTDLLKNVSAALSVNDTYSISIIDINHNESFGVNEDKFFHSASVTKLLTATAALQGVESGKYKLSQPMGIATFQYQLKQMVNQSNNNSWDFFNSLIGFKGQQQVADNLGLEGAKLTQTNMTTKAVAELLSKLYKGEALKSENRDLLFSYMQNTETENRISPAIPNGVTFYHKTGSFNGEIHDGALVIHPKNPFIIVIFTDDLRGTNWDSRFASFQKATKLVYSYFDSI
jgi:beta-lactamase class A